MQRESAYGVTVSYLPTFAQLETLLIGDPNKLWKKTANGDESHVYRYMNVWEAEEHIALTSKKLMK